MNLLKEATAGDAMMRCPDDETLKRVKSFSQICLLHMCNTCTAYICFHSFRSFTLMPPDDLSPELMALATRIQVLP